MKKFVVFLFSLFFLSINCFASDNVSSILIEASTGKVLMEQNSNEKMYPASMTKMMTLLIAMEKIDSNNIKFDDKVVVSENASKMGGSQVFLNVGEEITVLDLIKSICISSANDSAVALAEYIGGTEEKFVGLMNRKAKELGLTSTNFTNVHGLHDDNHYSSANDMAIIAGELIKHKKILEFTSIYEDYLKKNDGSSIWMVNTNKLIRYYKGMDGLKTGFTNESKYCLTATASRNDMRLISVVMGEETSEKRSKDTTELLDYGFNNYRIKTIMKKNADLGKAKVKYGKEDYVELKLVEDVNDLISIDDTGKYSYKIKVDQLKAPLKNGEIVGYLILDKDNNTINKYPITIKKDIKKANFLDLYVKNMKYLISGDV